MSNFAFHPSLKNDITKKETLGHSGRAEIFENGIGRLMTVKQLALFLACSEKTVRDWVFKGLVPVVRPMPRMVRFSTKDILCWLAERKG